MRFGADWPVCGAALAVLLSAVAPAAAQQQQQQAPAAGGAAPAVSSYASLLRDTETRLGQAIEQAQGTGRTQAGAMPPGQQQLMDATQAAWQAMQSGAPEAMRDGSGPYADADRTFRRAVEAMRVGSTPPDAAVAAAREAHAALGRLREATAAQGNGTAAGAPAPSPAASGQAPLQEPPRR